MKYSQLSDLKAFAESLAKNAGLILLEQQKNARIVKYKDLQDIATTADLASEKHIISKIVKKFPDHSVLSEERGEINKKSDFKWIVDPLDGTKDYVRGIPLYNVSLCLEFKGKPVIGVVYLPASDELYSASLGEGSYMNGGKIRVSDQKSLKSSYIGFYFPTRNRKFFNYEEGWAAMKNISEKCYRIRQDNCSNVALCLLARGGVEAYVNLTNPPHHHDLVTGLLIAKEAGAIVKEFGNGTFMVANNRYIFDALTDIINKQ